MTITLSNGKSFCVDFITTLILESRRIVIELADERTIAEVAADFEGAKTITRTDENRPNVKEVYEGFTRVVDVHRNTMAGTVRLTLEKGDAA